MEMILFFSVLVTISTAATRMSTITEHPHSIEVTEGMWANFTCVIKTPGNIMWRIGDFITKEGVIFNSLDNLSSLEGVTAERFPSDSTKNSIVIETIGVLATADMDGTAVQCMLYHPTNPSKHSYSKFALLNVNSTHTTSGSGELSTSF